jgi:hypothetical protein
MQLKSNLDPMVPKNNSDPVVPKNNSDPVVPKNNSDPVEAKNNSEAKSSTEVLLPVSNTDKPPKPPPTTGDPTPVKRPPTTNSEDRLLAKVANRPTTFLQLDTLWSRELLIDQSISKLMLEIISNSPQATAGRIMDKGSKEKHIHHLERMLKKWWKRSKKIIWQPKTPKKSNSQTKRRRVKLSLFKSKNNEACLQIKI